MKHLLLVGSAAHRHYVLERVLEAARELNTAVVLVDQPHRDYPTGTELTGLSSKGFSLKEVIHLPLHATDPSQQQTLAQQLSAELSRHGIRIDAVYTPFNDFAEIAAVFAQVLDCAGNPLTAVRAAQSKFRMRELFARDAALSIPYGIAYSEDDAARIFARISAACVAKPSRGAGSRGVIMGISSEDEARAAWSSINSYLQAAGNADDKKSGSARAGILFEQQLHGPEVDVELVLQRGRVCFAAVADNPEIKLPELIETSTTYPSQLPQAQQRHLINCAASALDLLGLKDGNHHVELVATDGGIKVIEVNPRMGGAFVWPAIQAAYGVDLIREGIRALFGRADRHHRAARCIIEAKFFVAAVSGCLDRVSGLDLAGSARGVRALQLWKNPGDMVSAPRDSASDYLGYLLVQGDSHGQAVTNSLAAMAKVRFQMTDVNNNHIVFNGTHMHGPG